MKRMFIICTMCTLSLFCIINSSMAQCNPSRLIANGMVIQRNYMIPFWGTANIGDSVAITFNSITDTAYADDNGKWRIYFPAMQAGGPHTMTIECNEQIITINSIYIGDVFLCSGQSNMEMAVSACNNATANIASANDQGIREFKIGKSFSNTPSDMLTSGSWNPATSAYVGSFSGTAYYFAKEMRKINPDVPIGIINTSCGGSRIETWMSKEMLGYDEQDIKLANGETERQPTLTYNTMIHPLIGVPISAFVWYQGESNADNIEDAKVYGEQFKALIKGWRDLWQLGNIPFIWVQLPNFGTAGIETNPTTWDAWPQLRAGQSRALSLTHTGEAVSIDVGELDIHPKDKESIGERLALVARSVVYNEDIVYNGPRIDSYEVLTDGRVQIYFNNIGGGLVAKDTSDGGLRWFSIAGTDGILRKANAVISDNSVIVSHPSITQPTIVRYAWEVNPIEVNFYNTEDLPAAPFKIEVPIHVPAIEYFTCTKTLIERGEFITLEWKTTGLVDTYLNNERVDSLSALRLMPLDTITFTLELIDIFEPSNNTSITITVNVINPRPTIKLSTLLGNISTPNDEVTIIADAKAPGGGTVTQVELYVDNEKIATITEAPFQTTWIPLEAKNYTILGLVINQNNDSTWSEPYTMYISNLNKIRYEAEFATLTGIGSKVTNSKTSGKKYIQVQEPFSLTFSNIEVDTAGSYQMIIRYLMNFDPTKEQFLYVNGTLFKTIRFLAPDTKTWMDYGIKVPLQQGINTIEIRNSWGWMSFDYIDILGANPFTYIEKINADSNHFKVMKQGNGEIMVQFNTSSATNTNISVYSMNGTLIEYTQYLNTQAGTQTCTLKKVYKPGNYIIKISNKDYSTQTLFTY